MPTAADEEPPPKRQRSPDAVAAAAAATDPCSSASDSEEVSCDWEGCDEEYEKYAHAHEEAVSQQLEANPAEVCFTPDVAKAFKDWGICSGARAERSSSPSGVRRSKVESGARPLPCPTCHTAVTERRLNNSFAGVSFRCCAKSSGRHCFACGDVITYEGRPYLVRSLSGALSKLHLQAVGQSLQFGGAPYRIVGDRDVFVLRKAHADVSLADLTKAWLDGSARVLSTKPVLFFTPNGTRDLLSVPGDAPRCCGCSDTCSCAFPWGGTHPGCGLKASAASAPGPPCIQQGEVTYRAGDWVKLRQAGPKLADQLNLLATTVSIERHPEAGLELSALVYDLQASAGGYDFAPRAAAEGVSEERLDGRVDPTTLPPGARVLLPDGAPDPEALAAPPTGVERVEILDLFSGAGGLSLGLEIGMRGLAQTRWAVDLFGEALDTLARSHPHATTFCQDACSFLAGCRDRKEGYPHPGPSPPGVLRMLVGGPPCQGFSGANRGEKEKKHRKNVLVPLFLSVLDTLRFDMMILKNVAGLLATEDTLECILTALASMGYQTRMCFLDAGGYGVAQHRVRVIILAALHGLPLPEIPSPTHVFNAGGYEEGQLRCTEEARRRQAQSLAPLAWRDLAVPPVRALLPGDTVRDIIGDLPAAAGSTEYGAAPAPSYFGRHMREGVAGDALTNHVTSALAAKTLDRVAAIPKEGQAPPEGQERWVGASSVVSNHKHPPRSGNWRDLPEELRQPSLKAAALALKPKGDDHDGMFGRLLWGGQFGTLLTTPALYSKTTGTIIHPEEDRPLTVREYARVQGFPDRVEFSGAVAQCYRQISNAVPVPLAEALGRSVYAALRLLPPAPLPPPVPAGEEEGDAW